MRITGHHLLERNAAAIATAQADVGRLADQLSSGVAVRRASDDPVAWAQARRDEVRAAVSRGRGEASGLVGDHLADSERALATIGGALSEARQLAVQGANASLGAADRAALASQVSGLFAAALAAANTQNAAGEYVLAGATSTTAPFDAAGAYLGDASARRVEVGEATDVTASLSGAALTAATGGVDVLPALARLATALAANDVPTVQAAIAELDAGHEQVSQARGDVGAWMAVTRDADAARGELEDHLQARIADLVETDLVAAATQLTQRSQALEAAQAVGGRLAQLLSPRNR